MGKDYVGVCVSCNQVHHAAVQNRSPEVAKKFHDPFRFDPTSTADQAKFAEWLASHVKDDCGFGGFVVEHRPQAQD